MFGICSRSVVFWPSVRFHVPVNTPPTPPTNGVTVPSFGLLLLKGVPKKPQTTGAVAGGVNVGLGEAWMWAAIRLSFVKGVCEPVTSMLKIVAENDIVSAVVSRVKVAKPEGTGRGSPPAPGPVVRFTGGGSWSTVMFAVRMMMSARAGAAAP